VIHEFFHHFLQPAQPLGKPTIRRRDGLGFVDILLALALAVTGLAWKADGVTAGVILTFDLAAAAFLTC
jgi:hypothetical protein